MASMTLTSATATNAGTVTLVWAAASGATGYTVEWSTTVGFTAGTVYSSTLGNVLTSIIGPSNLTIGTLTYFRIRPIGGTLTVSASKSATPAIKPTITATTLSTIGAVKIQWTALTNATAYKIQVSTSSTFASGVYEYISNAPDISNNITTNLTYGVINYFRAYATIDGTIYGAASANVSATPNVTSPVITASSAANNGNISVGWTAVNGLVYRVQWSTSSTFASYVASSLNDASGISTSPYSITGQPLGTVIYVRAFASSTNGSKYGTAASATVNAIPKTAPGQVSSGIAITYPATQQIRLAWSAPTVIGYSGALSYVPEYSTDNSTWTAISAVTTLYATFTGLTNGTPYYVRTTSRNAGLVLGTPSTSVLATPRTVPGAPTSVSAALSLINARSVIVSFTAPVSNGGINITSYTVTPSTTPLTPQSFTMDNITDNAGVLSVTVSGLNFNTSYTFTVKAVNGAGSSAASAASVAIRTNNIAGAPTAVTAALVSGSNTSASIAFNAPASTGGYSITHYLVTPYIGTTPMTDVSGSISPIIVSDISPGNSYTFKVRAVTFAGNGTQSVASSQLVPYYSKELPDGSAHSQPTGNTYENSVIYYTGLTYALATITYSSSTIWTVSDGTNTDTLTSIKKIIFSDKTVLLVDGGFGINGNKLTSAHASAANVSSNGDYIHFAPGTYVETSEPTVYKSVTLQGPISGPPAILSTSVSTYALSIKGHNITVKNLTIDTSSGGAASTSGYYSVLAAYALNIRPAGDTTTGTDMYSLNNITFDNVVFTNPLTKGLDVNGIQYLNKRGAAMNGINGLVFNNCTFAKTWNYGLTLASCKNVTITNSTFYSCPYGSIGIVTTKEPMNDSSLYNTENVVINDTNTFIDWDKPTQTEFVSWDGLSTEQISPVPIISFEPINILGRTSPITYGLNGSVNVILPSSMIYTYVIDPSVAYSSAGLSHVSKYRYLSTHMYLQSRLNENWYGKDISGERYFIEDNFSAPAFFSGMSSLTSSTIVEFQHEANLPTDASFNSNVVMYSTDNQRSYVYNANVSAARAAESTFANMWAMTNTISATMPSSMVNIKSTSSQDFTYSTDQYKNASATYPAIRSAAWYTSSASDRALLLTAADISASIVWPSASEITYGQDISSSMLSNGSVAVDGNFRWSSPSTVPNAGAYLAPVEFTPTNTSAYGGTFVSNIYVTVNKSSANIIFSNLSQAYTGAALNPTVVSDPPGLLILLSYTGAHTSIGNYPVRADISDSNYQGDASEIFVITKTLPTLISAPTASAITYGQTLASSTLSGGIASVSGEFSFEFPSTILGVSQSGTSQPVTFTPTDSTNYSTVSVLCTVAVTVNRSTGYTVTWPSDSDITYGESLSSSNLSGGSAVNNFNGNSVAGSFAFTNPSYIPNAGTANYSATFTPSDSVNYSVLSSSDLTMQVNQRPLTITASNDSKVYGSLKTFSTSAFETSGLVLSDSVTSVTLASPFGAVTTATVGSYGIVPSAASGSGLSNYSISYVNGSLTVSQKALTITASNQSKVYGEFPSFAGTEFSPSGLVNSDAVSSVTLTCSQYNAATATVGSYDIVPSAVQGSGLDNYSISYSNGSLTVSQKALTVTASNQSKVYGESKSFAGTEFSSSGLINSDSVSSVTLTCSQYNDATASAISYTIVPSAAAGSGLSNYSISYTNGSLTVSKKALVVTASAQTAVFGTLYTLDNTLVSANALQNSDAVASATLSCPDYTNDITALGSYTIIPIDAVFSNGNASNYDITYATGQLTIGPALPGQPEIISAVHSNTTAFVSWTQPVFDGGESVISNTLYWSADDFATEASENFLNNNTNTANISNLIVSNEYKFKVSASNSVGEGPLSLPFLEVLPINIQESTVSTFENINNGYSEELTVQEQEVLVEQIESVVETVLSDTPGYEGLEAIRAAADTAEFSIELTLTTEASTIAQIAAENGESYEPTSEERDAIIEHLNNAAEGTVDPELFALLSAPDTSIQSSAPAWNVDYGEQIQPYPVISISNEPSTVTTIYMIHDISASFYWSIPSNITAGLSGEVFVVRSANNTHITTLQAHTGVKAVTASLPLIAGNWFAVTLANDEIVTVRVPAMADFVTNISLNAPTGVQTNSGGAEADVSWDVDTTPYSDPITSYIINVYVKSTDAFVTSVNTNSRHPRGRVTGLTDNITYYFTVQAVNALGVGNESAPSGDYVPCFVKGTRIMTAAGYKAVETLTASDRVITADGRAVPFKLYSRVIEHCSVSTAPYLIKKGAFAANSPPRDITLSPNHAIQVRKGVWQIPRYAATMFSGVKQVNVGEKVEYFHVELPNFFTDNIIAEGCTVESYGAKQVKNVATVYKYNSNLKGFTRISAIKGIKAAKGE